MIYIKKYSNNKLENNNSNNFINNDKKCLSCRSRKHIRKNNSIYCECGYLIEIILNKI